MLYMLDFINKIIDDGQMRKLREEAAVLYQIDLTGERFTVRKGKKSTDSIGCFYYVVQKEIAFESTCFRKEVPCCRIAEAIYGSTHNMKQYKILITALSEELGCLADCTMENGCLLMQKLNSWRQQIQWYDNWCDEALKAGEDAVMCWLYGN